MRLDFNLEQKQRLELLDFYWDDRKKEFVNYNKNGSYQTIYQTDDPTAKGSVVLYSWDSESCESHFYYYESLDRLIQDLL